MLECYISNVAESTDEALTNETDVPEIKLLDLGGFHANIYKCGHDYRKNVDRTQLGDSMIEYEGRMKPMPSKIDGKSFNTHGITHAVG